MTLDGPHPFRHLDIDLSLSLVTACWIPEAINELLAELMRGDDQCPWRTPTVSDLTRFAQGSAYLRARMESWRVVGVSGRRKAYRY
jgi:hypothetical protein